MNILSKASFFLVGLVLTAGVLHAQKVTADYDKSVDFSQYKTYYFMGWEKESEKLLNDFDKRRIRDAFTAELTARGMTEGAEGNADLGITGFIVIENKTSTTAYTTYTGGYGYRPARWGWGAGMGSSMTTYSEDDYTEGTLVVDMYDNSSKNLVWQGVMVSTVEMKSEKREKTIPKKVKKMMKKYPVKPLK